MMITYDRIASGIAKIQREREIQSKGGKASGESKRERKRLRILLEEALDSTTNKDGEELSRREITAIELAEQMSAGNLKAIEIGAKLLGEFKPDTEIEINTGPKFMGFSSVLPIVPNIEEICAQIDAERELKRGEE